MSPGYPHFPLRRGDIYEVKVPYVEDPKKADKHPALVLRDERAESPSATFTLVAFGTSVESYKNHPLALCVNPAAVHGLNLRVVTYFLAYRIHPLQKDKYFSGANYLGRLPRDTMDRFDELLVSPYK